MCCGCLSIVPTVRQHRGPDVAARAAVLDDGLPWLAGKFSGQAPADAA
jgi:hypothetical protein